MSSESALEQERAARESLFLKAILTVHGREHEGRVSNLSETGAFVVAALTLSMGQAITIRFRGVDKVEAVVRRVTSKGFGIQFAEKIDPRNCRNMIEGRSEKRPNEYMLHLRESNRRPIWDTGSQPFRRPGIKEAP